MKDNFLLKKKQREVFETLTDEEAGKLIKGVFEYLETGDSKLVGTLKAIFIPIKDDIDENERKYKKRCEILNKNRNHVDINMNSYRNQDDISSDNNHISYITNHLKEINNKKNNRGMGEEEKEERRETFKQIIDYLNQKTNSSFKYTTKSTQQKINARLNEGYELNDFIAVIDKKWIEWKNTEFEKYLCPETLFGAKFEKYLNQKIKREITTKDIEDKVNLKSFFGGNKK